MSSRSNFRKKDRMDTQVSSDHVGKKTFRCEICEKSFANVTKLNEHISALSMWERNHINVTFVITYILIRLI